MSRGLFLAIEGIEGSGKTTQSRKLVEWLDRRGIPHVAVREPGGTGVGEEIREILLDGGSLTSRTELLLMLAARAAVVQEVIVPALEAGKVVVTDRFELSTLAYQGYGRGLPLDAVRRINAFATGGIRPDLTLVLEVPQEEGERRRAAAGRGPDRIERAGREFHQRVAEAYALLSTQEPDVERVDGTGPADRVQAEIRARLSARFPETFASGPG